MTASTSTNSDIDYTKIDPEIIDSSFYGWRPHWKSTIESLISEHELELENSVCFLHFCLILVKIIDDEYPLNDMKHIRKFFSQFATIFIKFRRILKDCLGKHLPAEWCIYCPHCHTACEEELIKRLRQFVKTKWYPTAQVGIKVSGLVDYVCHRLRNCTCNCIHLPILPFIIKDGFDTTEAFAEYQDAVYYTN